MTLQMRYAALSDVGRIRKDNQDAGYASRHLLVVADGVGGQAFGDVASAESVAALRRLDVPPPDDMIEALAGAMHRANDRLTEVIETRPETEGMGTTMIAMLFNGEQVAMGHIGDSRAYLLRDGELAQLTQDHTFVQSLVDEGRITEEEARFHPHRNLVLRVLQGQHDIEPDLTTFEVQPADRLLICSDGLSGFVDADEIAELLGRGSIDDACANLVRVALTSGSTDNVTVVIGEIVDGSATTGTDGAAPPLAAVDDAPMVVGSAAEPMSPARGPHDTSSQQPVVDDETSVDPEELRYAPRAPRRFRWLVRASVLIVLLIVAGIGATLGYNWTQQQYYVGTYAGQVTIYKGVSQDVPGITLHSVFEQTALTVEALPSYNQQQVTSGIDADNLTDARVIVNRLQALADKCANGTSTTGCTGATAPTTPPATRPTKKPVRHHRHHHRRHRTPTSGATR
ncbi:MAG: PP2C family protein-serine/threonine phosphatase [Nocardioidaceae bacterium]